MIIEEQFKKDILKKLDLAYTAANKAKSKGYDPDEFVNIPLAKDAIGRVEGLVSVICPQIMNTGIPDRIKELETIYGKLDWRVALKISLEVAQQKFCKFQNQKEAIETGIRMGIAYLTLGIVASPLEGFVGIKFRKRFDGNEYMALMYSGPIRSAGGTAGALSVIVADYVRKNFGYAVYDPSEKEVKRMVTELYDYHERVTNLQYLPNEKEISLLVSNLPVQIDGDPSEKINVSNYKDIERIETNKIRGGPCLVIGECLAQKATKVWNQLRNWNIEFGLEHWAFMQDLVDLKMLKSNELTEKVSTKKELFPIYTYIQDLVAGRPVLGYPLAIGGFRLRYGRCRTSGYSASSIHPATMIVLNKYIAIGTQLKIERPGKATAVTICDSIEGPIVKLEDDSVVRLDSEQKARQLMHTKSIKEILFLGDILINYGDFYNRAHRLVPAGYCEEWWALEVEKAIVSLFGSLDYGRLAELINVDAEHLEKIIKKYFYERPDPKTAIAISKILNVSLHPYFTYHWKTISSEDFFKLLRWFTNAKFEFDSNTIIKIILPKNDDKRILELIGLPHIFVNNEFVVIEKEEAEILSAILNLNENDFFERYTKEFDNDKNEDIFDLMFKISKIKQSDKSGTFIGSRMGRPEKAKVRKLVGEPHMLFPVGKEGGKIRSFQNAMEIGYVEAEFFTYLCDNCKKETIFSVCEVCDIKTKKTSEHKMKRIDINLYLKNILKKINMKQYPDLVKGVRGTSNKNHIPEHLGKGILRAKYNLPVNRDGTTRYDMTQLPITHFKPKEIGTSIEKLRELGYENDIYGLKLDDSEQVLELRPQDIILPKCEDSNELGIIGSDDILYSLSLFVDDILTSLYGIKKFYNLKSKKDLIGHLVVALAPHTSAGIIGRVIGFSKIQALYAHPLFHAATRRDCDGDEASVALLMDVLLNFSRQFLPDSRGSTQDAPLVLTSILNPNEVDDMAFDLDVVQRYPLEFYQATQEYSLPKSVKIVKMGDIVLNNELKNELKNDQNKDGRIFYTHDVDNINSGVRQSSYKTIPSMEDKLKGQMELADKIRAVDAIDVARLVIEKHLLRDIKGNLRKFSTQSFRCSKCTEKYRRPPLLGKCISCGSKIIFTVSEGTIIKYLEPAISLSEKYNLPPYLKQTLYLTKNRIEGIFGKEREKQEGLKRWFG